MSQLLAIVIHTYRSRFIAKTLDALLTQSSHEFNLYIGDDHSPDDIESIVNPYAEKLKIEYKRFPENVGQKSLTKHWERCIKMAQEEHWIWLLPDDDVPNSECVATFLNAINTKEVLAKVFRFQTVHINVDDEVIFQPVLCPTKESNVDFILKKMRYERNSSVAEYIFDKAEYYKVERFTDIPMGWCSDDMMWIKLSQQHDIETLPAGVVQLRQSDVNISSNNRKHYEVKLNAKYTFLQRLFQDRAFMKKVEATYSIERFKKEVTTHLFNEFKGYSKRFLNSDIFSYAKRNDELIGGGFLKNIYRLLRYQIKK